ncbi:MAG TPA: hypothetical protein VKB41_09230 [Steroidobacteraceae bacterium]|nr:hypothetical protein [Steroidobacteraceae bacterium]
MAVRTLILGALVVAGTAAAQSPADIAKCTAIATDAERLACYDRLFARSAEPAKSAPNASTKVADTTTPATAAGTNGAGAAGATTAATTAAAKHDDFGFDGRPPPGQKEQQPAGPDQMDARIANVATQARGEHVLTLDNGQVWQQKEPDWHLAFNVGDEVTIKRGTMKSYRLQLKGNNRATAVTRIR